MGRHGRAYDSTNLSAGSQRITIGTPRPPAPILSNNSSRLSDHRDYSVGFAANESTSTDTPATMANGTIA